MDGCRQPQQLPSMRMIITCVHNSRVVGVKADACGLRKASSKSLNNSTSGRALRGIRVGQFLL
jgi:hypothetical protein